MSHYNKEQFNIWFPAIVVGVIVSVIATCMWEVIKDRVLHFFTWLCPCIRREVSLDQPRDQSATAAQESWEREETSRQRIEERRHMVAEVLTMMYSEISLGRVSPTPRPDPLPQGEITEDGTTGNMPASALPLVDITQLAESSNSSNIAVMTNDLHIDVPEERNFPVGTSAPNDAFEIQASTSSSLPALRPVGSTATAYIPDGAPARIVSWVYELFSQYATGAVNLWKSSVILQAPLSIDSRVLAEMEALAKRCIRVEKSFTLQVGDWGIFCYNDGRFQLYTLKGGDVPVNLGARWHKKRTGIIMNGLYLNGAQIKAATTRTSTTLTSAGPPSQGRGHLDELYIPTEGLDVGNSLIHASKVVEVDNFALVVRSEATYIVPPQGKPSPKEALWDRLQKIAPSTMKMKSLLRFQVCQPKTTQRQAFLREILQILQIRLDPDTKSISDLKTKRQLLVEYWKGVSQIEMLDCRHKVLHHLQQLPVANCTDSHPSHFTTMTSSRDREYWQSGLHDMNEVIRRNLYSSQSSTLLRIRGGIKFFLGEFESALQDFDLADKFLNIEGRPSSTVLERAIVKCVLARYSEAMEDVITAAAINPNLNDVKKYQSCLEQILRQKQELCTDLCAPSLQQPQLSNELKPVQAILDLLTGEEWYPDHHYPSARIRRMMEQRPMFDSMLDFEIEASKSHWTEVDDLDSSLTGLEELSIESVRAPILRLRRYDWLSIGDKIGEGGQAEIFDTIVAPEDGCEMMSYVIKVFKKGFTLAQLKSHWFQTEAVFLDEPSPAVCAALGANLMRDNRLWIVFPRLWGDLRKLIDQRMMENTNKASPFDFVTSVRIALQIAEGMLALHTCNVLHRDLKASNVLVSTDRLTPSKDFQCKIADFECSMGVVGTGFWRAPEILQAIKNRTLTEQLFSKAADVYGYAMTCYEILTGNMPFEDRLSDRECTDMVLSGCRPTLPSGPDSALTSLIECCWHQDPERRPSFSFICEKLRRISSELKVK